MLAADVVGLADAANQEKVCLIGHDWGAAVAWWVAAKYPDRVSHMVAINGPHGTVMQKHLRSSIRQLAKSWYLFFFQLPKLPEALAQIGNWRATCRALQRSSRPGTFSSHDLDEYRKAWSQAKAYTSMVNWYRAIIQKPPLPLPDPRISVPTLLIWGAKDRFLGREMAQPSMDLCEDGRLIFIEEATHWVQHEEAERVNSLLGEFLTYKME